MQGRMRVLSTVVLCVIGIGSILDDNVSVPAILGVRMLSDDDQVPSAASLRREILNLPPQDIDSEPGPATASVNVQTISPSMQLQAREGAEFRSRIQALLQAHLHCADWELHVALNGFEHVLLYGSTASKSWATFLFFFGPFCPFGPLGAYKIKCVTQYAACNVT